MQPARVASMAALRVHKFRSSSAIKGLISSCRHGYSSPVSLRFLSSHDHSHDHSEATEGETAVINWVLKDGSQQKTIAPLGINLMRLAHRNDIELEGACEGVCACSTCHVILDGDVYDSLPEPSEDEEDMLDQAFGLTPTSRLGCQVEVTKDVDGITVRLPKATRNFYVVRFISLI